MQSFQLPEDEPAHEMPAPAARCVSLWTSMQIKAYVDSTRQKVLAAAGGTAAPGTSSAGGARGGEAQPVERMRRLCMVVEHERQHQETLCYMLAQQRKADAASIAAGRAPVVTASSEGRAAGQPAAGGVLPFYPLQCSYASASACAVTSTFPASSKAQQGCTHVPGTPARQAERLPQGLAALQLASGTMSTNGSGAGPANGTFDWVSVPAAEVGISPFCSFMTRPKAALHNLQQMLGANTATPCSCYAYRAGPSALKTAGSTQYLDVA